MTSFVIPPHILELPPKERVIAAGLAWLKHNGKMPTQDKLVQALAGTDGEKGTGKGTVNKYWPDLQNEIARELSLVKWLPAELPEFVIDHLKQLIDWARQDAQAQLDAHQNVLDERERKLNEEAETRKLTETTLRDRISELETSLKDRDGEVSKLRDKQASLEQSLAETQRMAAVQQEQLNYAAEREAELSEKIAELKQQVRASQDLLSEKKLELQAKQKDISLLESQLQSLQHHHDEQLRLVSSFKYQVTELKEQAASEEKAAKDAIEKAQKELQSCKTKLARQEGQLVVLDTLQSSVGTLKEALNKEQERNQALEREKANLDKLLKQLSRKSKKKKAS